MSKAIETRYMGYSATKPARIIARAWPNLRMVRVYDSGMTPEDNHSCAAAALISAYGWGGKWIMGSNVKGDGYYHVKV